MDISFAGFTLRSRDRALVGPDGPVDLSARSFDILSLLVERPGDVVAKADLLERVWSGLTVEDNTLQVHMSALRKAVGPALIVTVHGRGYKYVGPPPSKVAAGAAEAVAARRPGRRPVVLVMPLENLSGDPNQQFFSDGITDDIIDRLSRHRIVSVIGRHSAFAVRDQGGNAQETLAADYVVTGNIRKSADRVRVAARLTEAGSGSAIWAEHYDRPLTDVFAIQDELARVIASTLVGRVEMEVATRPPVPGAARLSSYEHVLKGMWHYKKLTLAANAEAARCFREAIAVFPQNAQAHRWLAGCEAALWLYEFDRDGLARGLAHAGRAIELDPASADCYSVRGFCQLWLEGPESAAASIETALTLNPGDPNILAHAGLIEAYRGNRMRFDQFLGEAYRLNPLPPAWYAEYRGPLDFAEQNYAAAAPSFLAIPDAAYDVMYALACLGHMGDRAGINRLRQRMDAKGQRWDFLRGGMAEPFADASVKERLVEGLRAAGVVS